MYRFNLNDNEELVIYVDKLGEPCYTVIDHSKLFNRKKYFNTQSLDNPNYIRELKRAEKAKGKNKDKEVAFDTTETIPEFNFNHNICNFKKEINRLLVEDDKCYAELEQGIISYAKDEIAEVQHHIDTLFSKEDKVDFMAAIQRKKRHAKYLRLVFIESENRKTMRALGYDRMDYFKLSYISQCYVALLYSWGYSAEAIEALMGLKNGYINHITKHIEQRVKREMIIEFEVNLAWKSIERFEQLVLSTGKNITEAQRKEIVDLYLITESIPEVVELLGYSDTTVRRWVGKLVSNNEPAFVA